MKQIINIALLLALIKILLNVILFIYLTANIYIRDRSITDNITQFLKNYGYLLIKISLLYIMVIILLHVIFPQTDWSLFNYSSSLFTILGGKNLFGNIKTPEKATREELTEWLTYELKESNNGNISSDSETIKDSTDINDSSTMKNILPSEYNDLDKIRDCDQKSLESSPNQQISSDRPNQSIITEDLEDQNKSINDWLKDVTDDYKEPNNFLESTSEIPMDINKDLPELPNIVMDLNKDLPHIPSNERPQERDLASWEIDWPEWLIELINEDEDNIILSIFSILFTKDIIISFIKRIFLSLSLRVLFGYLITFISPWLSILALIDLSFIISLLPSWVFGRFLLSGVRLKLLDEPSQPKASPSNTRNYSRLNKPLKDPFTGQLLYGDQYKPLPQLPVDINKSLPQLPLSIDKNLPYLPYDRFNERAISKLLSKGYTPDMIYQKLKTDDLKYNSKISRDMSLILQRSKYVTERWDYEGIAAHYQGTNLVRKVNRNRTELDQIFDDVIREARATEENNLNSRFSDTDLPYQRDKWTVRIYKTKRFLKHTLNIILRK